ncbi:MAG: PLP-dependent aminotransferase family protein [Solirubrobacterales bacterium]
MDKFRVDFKEEEESKYITIANHIKKLIDENYISDGEKLPSIRALSVLLKVNSVTVVNAYKKLENEGYALLKIGSGTFAKLKDSSRNVKKDYSSNFKRMPKEMMEKYIDFTGEALSTDFFPIENFKMVLNEVIDRDGAEALVIQEALGYEGLRDTISNVFWKGKVNPDDVLIVSGAQQGIDIISKALINSNDYILVEKPTYSGALSVFKSRRANILEIPISKGGVDVEKLEKLLMKNDIRCFYLMSYFQNPSGMSYSLEAKKKILRLAEIYDFFIIEDDYLSELIFDEGIEYSTFKSLDTNNRVIYIKSFSKIFLPGIRLGYLVAPGKYKEPIENSKFNTDISTSSIMQRALELYINKGLWINYIGNLIDAYKKRYYFMEKCINEKLGDKIEYISPGGGLNFYLKLSNSVGIDSTQLYQKAKSKKVLIAPGVLFYKNPEDGKRYFRVSFSKTDEDKIARGMDILSRIISEN